jgi:hypothetical protein
MAHAQIETEAQGINCRGTRAAIDFPGALTNYRDFDVGGTKPTKNHPILQIKAPSRFQRSDTRLHLHHYEASPGCHVSLDDGREAQTLSILFQSSEQRLCQHGKFSNYDFLPVNFFYM